MLEMAPVRLRIYPENGDATPELKSRVPILQKTLR